MKSRSAHGITRKPLYCKEIRDEYGNLKASEEIHYLEKEPGYVKFYATGSDVCEKLKFVALRLLVDLVMTSSFPTSSDPGGVIHLTSLKRQEISVKNGIGVRRFGNILTKLVEVDFMVRLGRSAYMINPRVAGKGKWIEAINAERYYLEAKSIQANIPEQPE